MYLHLPLAILIHGHARRIGKTPTYNSWRAMCYRCNNPNDSEYHRYGGRGIKVCSRWSGEFQYFLEDMGERPAGKYIDRINNDGDYCKENCRWADRLQQNNNTVRSAKHMIFGETKTLSQWARDSRIRCKKSTFFMRIYNGWDKEKALITATIDSRFKPTHKPSQPPQEHKP